FGEDALIIVSVATYHFAPNFMRKAANAKEETQYWMRSSMSGGVSPSPHFIGGVQEDKRVFQNGADMLLWHKQNEEYLYNRTLISGVGFVRSLRNTCFYGKDKNEIRVTKPMYGILAALKRGRIPYFPIDSRQIADKLPKTKLLVLPDIAVLTDDELKTIEGFIKSGGSIVFTGATGMLDEFGYPRKSFPLDELLGIEREEKEPVDAEVVLGTNFALHNHAAHNYIRIAEPRHEIFKGFEETPIIGLHGTFYKVKSSKLAEAAHMIPSFPTYPPEASFMNDGEHVSEHPGILIGETGYGGRAVYFAADFDRLYGQFFFPDHGDLLKNAIIWALGEENLPFTVEGRGELDCKLFSQNAGKRFVLHIVNYSGLGKWPGSAEEIYPVGPEKVRVNVGALQVKSVRMRSTGELLDFSMEDGMLTFTIGQITDQDIIVIE
ncbi:MAG: beta-galactosidase trimerization domain-containing protein, partial [Oscillospiraceae bacterium]|nr:beta-galactosidase trimerization domain-containing protein [Oscillospiraceae bacterium]